MGSPIHGLSLIPMLLGMVVTSIFCHQEAFTDLEEVTQSSFPSITYLDMIARGNWISSLDRLPCVEEVLLMFITYFIVGIYIIALTLRTLI